jgi:hypothetical protein
VPIVYVMPQAHVRFWPRSKGDGRFRARPAANSRAPVAYSLSNAKAHGLDEPPRSLRIAVSRWPERCGDDRAQSYLRLDAALRYDFGSHGAKTMVTSASSR